MPCLDRLIGCETTQTALTPSKVLNYNSIQRQVDGRLRERHPALSGEQSKERGLANGEISDTYLLKAVQAISAAALTFVSASDSGITIRWVFTESTSARMLRSPAATSSSI